MKMQLDNKDAYVSIAQYHIVEIFKKWKDTVFSNGNSNENKIELNKNQTNKQNN